MIERCPECGGDGRIQRGLDHSSPHMTCPLCNGSGRVRPILYENAYNDRYNTTFEGKYEPVDDED